MKLSTQDQLQFSNGSLALLNYAFNTCFTIADFTEIVPQYYVCLCHYFFKDSTAVFFTVC